MTDITIEYPSGNGAKAPPAGTVVHGLTRRELVVIASRLNRMADDEERRIAERLTDALYPDDILVTFAPMEEDRS